MKITLTKAEMLRRRRIAGGLEPHRADCAIEQTDGIDIDAVLELQLRQWYLDLLDKGSVSEVAPSNIAASVEISAVSGNPGGTVLTPPEMCRRVFAVKLKGWLRAVEVEPASEAERIIQLQSNPYTAATAAHPVAVATGGASGGRASEILAWPAATQALTVTAAIDPGEDYYTFDESALASMPSTQILLEI